jgi:hypothetical protein
VTHFEFWRSFIDKVSLDIEVSSTSEYILTEVGEMLYLPAKRKIKIRKQNNKSSF